MNRIATRLAVTATALALSAVALQAATVRVETSSHAMSGMDAARSAWSTAAGPDAIRAVFHRDVDDDGLSRAVVAFNEVLGR